MTYGYDILKEWPGIQDVNMTKVCIIDELLMRKRFSPDFGNVRNREDILLFVYDEFQRQGSMNPVLSESKFLGQGRTAANNFQMKNGRHNVPVVLSNNSKGDSNKGFIRGEVYAVPPETLLQVDKMNSNTVRFRRQKKYIFLLDQEYQTKKGNKRPSVECFMYLGVPEFWENQTLWNAPSMIPKNDKSRRYYDYIPKNLSVFARRGIEGYGGWPDMFDQSPGSENWMM